MKALVNILLVFVLLLPACNSSDCDPNQFCDTVVPTDATLSVSVTIDDENFSVPIAIYLGQFEDGNLVFLDTLESSSQDYIVPIEEYYSVTARYKDGSNTIMAVDGDRVSYSVDDNCGDNCYTVQNGFIDLKKVN